MTLDATQVADYLRENPDFFESNVTLLTDVEIPHPHGGRAISISERQILALREKNRLIENKLAELIQFGEENDGISEKIHRFACALTGAKDLNHILSIIYLHFQDYFTVPHTAVRLWHPALESLNIKETSKTSVEIRQFVANLKTPYCGNHSVYESSQWFGESASHLRSFAMVKIGTEQSFGALLLASEDAQRFYAEMGTLYLVRLGELISCAIEAHLI